MTDEGKFSLLRKVLRALGLSPESVDDLVARVARLLSDLKGKPADQFPYHLRDDFLSAAEHSFYHVLAAAANDWALVCPKVSLGDLFYAKASDYGELLTYTNKIDRKHVDFLLCDPDTLQPLVGIELDDRSHRRRDRQERDAFVDRVFEAAGLPLVRTPVQRDYDVAELTALLRERTTPGAVPDSPQQESPESAIPLCPKCDSPMVLRTAKRGPNAGTQFWGCPNYPRCHGIRQTGGEDL